MKRALTIAEFYSGIGGFHFAAKALSSSVKILAAFDVDLDANAVYFHNTGLHPEPTNLESIPLTKLSELGADVWLLSPPCQPFTRQGKQLDDQDPRSFSFLKLLEKLGQLSVDSRPKYLCVENVVGFEQSKTRMKMIHIFRRCGLHTFECVLSPEQFGIPYSRPRYFCLARQTPFPVCPDETHSRIPGMEPGNEVPLEAFLDGEVSPDLFVSDKCLEQCGDVMNVVSCDVSMIVNCFTKSYGGRYFKGTGSYLATEFTGWIPLIQLLQDFVSGHLSITDTVLFSQNNKTGEERRRECRTLLVDLLRRMKIRFFSPAEVARIHSFPEHFHFPSHIRLRRQYALLGNSLCIHVVNPLLQFLISE